MQKDKLENVSPTIVNTMLFDVHSSLLHLFKGNENAYRGWQSEPFLIGGNAYATDAHSIVFFALAINELKNILQKKCFFIW